MSGRAFGNRFTFLWPTAKIAVMGPKQIAGVMSQVRRGQAARKGNAFDEEEDAQIVAAVEAVQEPGSLALVATGAVSDDGIIDPRDTRTVLGHVPVGRAQQRGRGRAAATGCSGCDATPDRLAARRQPRRDRPPRLPHRARRWACAASRCTPTPTPTRRSCAEADEAVALCRRGYLDIDGDHRRRAAQPAPTPSTPATASCRRTPRFADAVVDAGLVWVGPSPDVIAAMGDKLAAKRAAGRGRRADAAVDRIDVDARRRRRLPGARQGGGRRRRQGHARSSTSPAELAEAVAARRAARPRGAFGDDTRVPRALRRPGRATSRSRSSATPTATLVHLGERECSIQRRHQKIVEESPSPVGRRRDARAAMGDAALAARAGASATSRPAPSSSSSTTTTGEFFFLEVNTRLQVEHPVTEAVTGIDLVREQLRIADGRAARLRRRTTSRSRGHAIEVRLYAEDPADGFLPATGTLAAFAAGADAGGAVGLRRRGRLGRRRRLRPDAGQGHRPRADPREAAARLALALERAAPRRRDDEPRLPRRHAAAPGVPRRRHHHRLHRARRTRRRRWHSTDDELQRAATLAALWLQGRNRAAATVLAGAAERLAQRPAARRSRSRSPRGDRHASTVRYQSRRDGSFARRRRRHAPRVHRWSPTSIDVEVDGRRVDASRSPARRPAVRAGAARHRRRSTSCPASSRPARRGRAGGLVGADARAWCSTCAARRATRSPAGQTLVVLEAMKMEHHMQRPRRRRRRRGARRAASRSRTAPCCSCSSAVEAAGDGDELMTEPIRIANCSGFYGDRLSAAARDGRGRADRRAHRRLARRADDADPRPHPGEAARRRLRPHASSPRWSR